MECLFFPDLNRNHEFVLLKGNELKHARALHLQKNEFVLVTNGKGLTAETLVENFFKEELILRIVKYLENSGENILKVTLAIGVLNDRERFEFAIEKAVEMGVNEIIPLITQYSQPKQFNIKRLELKALAALKQSKRSYLPIIHSPIKVMEFIPEAKKFQNIILFDEKGNKPNIKKIDENLLILIGSEGGFSEIEINLFNSLNNIEVWNLCNRRLRTETAAISALSLINILL